MNVADYKQFDVINGEGMRHSLFVSGCAHHSCKGCFNAIAWDFDFGIPYTKEFEQQIIDDLNIPNVYISGLSILGGEPLDNLEGLTPLAKRVKMETDKNIWCWTGYVYEDLMSNEKAREFLSHVDVLIDGPFDLDKKDLSLKWRGSSNQRILKLRKGGII